MENKILQFIQLPTIIDDCSLTVAESGSLPFQIKRVYYIYNSKPNLPRGHHAHKQTQQVLFCLRGSVKMVLDDGSTRGECVLDTPDRGILLDKMVWHEMHDLQPETILLVFASLQYDEQDYIRNYKEFKNLILKEQ